MATLSLEYAIGYSGTLPNSLVKHPNGQDYVLVISPASAPQKQIFLTGHSDDITCLDVSRSGRYLATGQKGEESDVIVWDYASQKIIYRLQEHDSGISSVNFSHDEKLLVTLGSQDRRMVIWDMATGYIVFKGPQDPLPTTIARFAGMVQDVKRRDTTSYQLVTAGTQQLKVLALDPYAGDVKSERMSTGTAVRDYSALAFSPDYQLLFAGSTSGDVSVLSIKFKNLVSTIPACSGGVRALYALKTGGVVIGGGDGSIRVFGGDPQRMVEQRRAMADAPVTSISAVATADDELLIGTASGSKYVARLSEGLQVRRVAEAHSGPIFDALFPFDMNDRFGTVSQDGIVRFWDAAHYVVVSRGQMKGAYPTCIGFAGPCLVAGCNDGFVRSYDMDGGRPLWEIKDVHRGGVTALSVSTNERFIVTGGEGGEVRVWELRTREMVSHLKEHTARVTRLAVFTDDMHVMSVSKDRALLIWDLKSEKRVGAHVLRTGAINSAAMFRDQTRVVSVGQDKRVTFWDLRTKEPTGSIPTPGGDEPTALGLSYNNNLFATGCAGGVVNLWDARTNAPLTNDAGVAGQAHTSDVTGITFSPDDRRMVSVGLDGNCFVWDL